MSNKLGPFSKLLAQTDDYELVNGTDELIEARYEGIHNVWRFTPEVLVITQVWRVEFCINEGGFEYLFHESYEGDRDFRLSVEAFKTLGLMGCYKVLQDALELCGPIDPKAEIACPQFVAATTQEQRYELDGRFYDENPDKLVERTLAAYIRANADKLQHLNDPPPRHSSWDSEEEE